MHESLNNLISIKNAINDCTDFSAGEYSIDKLDLLNCGDKGLSIGEKSIVYSDKIFIKNANIGIATKDSSYLKLNFTQMSKLKTCVSAYNKKQEFYSRYIGHRANKISSKGKKYRSSRIGTR